MCVMLAYDAEYIYYKLIMLFAVWYLACYRHHYSLYFIVSGNGSSSGHYTFCMITVQ